MAPVVTGPKRTNKKGKFHSPHFGLESDLSEAFNQNPVFSVLADDGASTPGRERQSPSHGKIYPSTVGVEGSNNEQALSEVEAS